jgi:hypothetical protein
MSSVPNRPPWFLRPAAIVFAILAIGPFAIPLVWMSGSFKKWQKWTVTAALVILTVFLLKAGADIYKLLLKDLQDLRTILRY